MFGFFKKKQSHTPTGNAHVLAMRETLFGELPLDALPPLKASSGEEGPWGRLTAGRDAAKAGHRAEAERIYRELLSEQQESRVVAQIWHALRELGINPQGTEVQVVGAVAEAGINGGLDIVAAFRDGTARYWNYTGTGVVWERNDAQEEISANIRRLLDAADRIAVRAGVHDASRPPPPVQGNVRLTAVATDGLHFGEASMLVFQRDPVAGPFMSEATQLMQRLMDHSLRGKR